MHWPGPLHRELAQRCDERARIRGLVGDPAMVEVEEVDRTVFGQHELTRLTVPVHHP